VQTLALIASDAEPDKEAKSQEKETTTHAPDEMEQDSSRTESEGEGGKGRKVRGAEGQHVGPKSAGGETRTRAGRHAATSAATSAATLATLVVCPTSILQQWADEARRHLVWGEEGGRVVIYHGSQRAAGLSTAALRRARLVLTSYGVVAAEFSHAGGAASVRCRGQGGSETHAEEGGDVNLFDVAWYRVVLDEAHLIKSRSSVSSRAVVALPTERRWALTGTPLHNTCDDLLALLLFLRAEPWADASWWNRAILRPLTQNPGDQGVLQLLRGILGTLMLRRTARSSPSSTRHPDGGLVAGRLMNGGEEGEEGEEETAVVGQPRGEERCVDADDDDEGGGCSVDIDLPAKVVEVEEVVFSEEERGVYDAIFAQSKLKYEELVTGDTTQPMSSWTAFVTQHGCGVREA
jgi:SNF2 family DNA or RNA helicase